MGKINGTKEAVWVEVGRFLFFAGFIAALAAILLAVHELRQTAVSASPLPELMEVVKTYGKF